MEDDSCYTPPGDGNVFEEDEQGMNMCEGEAPESDDEEEDTHHTSALMGRLGVNNPLNEETLVPGEGSDTEVMVGEEPILEKTTRNQIPHIEPQAVSHVVVARSTSPMIAGTVPLNLAPNTPPQSANIVPIKQTVARPPRYNTLLHSKLREANERLNVHATLMFNKEFEQANKNLKLTSQHLSRSKQSIQDISNTMRLITNDLFQLEDKIGIVSSCTLLPELVLR